jgi:glycerol uptake facilitator-like aquaporin
LSKTTAISVGLSWRDALAYIPAQVAGCLLGAIIANGMFALAAVSISTHHRATPAHLFSEVVWVIYRDPFRGQPVHGSAQTPSVLSASSSDIRPSASDA